MFLLLAFEGFTVASNLKVPPGLRFISLLLSVMFVTGVSTSMKNSVFNPLWVVAVIIVLPLFFDVTTPFESTVATELLLLVHWTFLFVVSLGVILTCNWRVWFSPIVTVLSPTLSIPLASIPSTRTVHLASKPPSSVVITISAFPSETPVTTPFASTVATFSFKLLKVTLVFVALLGSTEYLIFPLPPTNKPICW